MRDRLFALMDKHILPGINRKVGRPGMAMWSILVMAVVKQGLGCDFDRLHELVNQHMTLRQFLGHADIRDKKRYRYQTLVDNVSLLNPELLGKVNQLIVESGHTVVGTKPGEPLRGRCDSFVAETNVHYPTDVNLQQDAMLCMHRHAEPLGSKHKVLKWRQWQKLQKTLIEKFNKIRKIRRASRKDIKAYLKFCAELIGRVKALLLELATKRVSPQKINKITYFVMNAVRQIDASFNRGFHSPANRARLDEVLDDNVLPKKGCLSRAERNREQGETFACQSAFKSNPLSASSAPRCGVGHQQS